MSLPEEISDLREKLVYERFRSAFYKGIIEMMGINPPPFTPEGVILEPLPKIEITVRRSSEKTSKDFETSKAYILPDEKEERSIYSDDEDHHPPEKKEVSRRETKRETKRDLDKEPPHLTEDEEGRSILDTTDEPEDVDKRIELYIDHIYDVSSYGEPIGLVLLQTLFTEADTKFKDLTLSEFETWLSRLTSKLTSNLEKTAFYDCFENSLGQVDVSYDTCSYVLARIGYIPKEPIDISILTPIISDFSLENYSLFYGLKPFDSFIDDVIKPFISRNGQKVILTGMKGLKYCMTKLAECLSYKMKEVCIPYFKKLHKKIYYHNNYTDKLTHPNLQVLFSNVEKACIPSMMSELLRRSLLPHLDVEPLFPPSIQTEMALLGNGIPPSCDLPDTLNLLYDFVPEEASIKYIKKLHKALKDDFSYLRDYSREISEKVSRQVALFKSSYLEE